jgi:hypothetical protein
MWSTEKSRCIPARHLLPKESEARSNLIGTWLVLAGYTNEAIAASS